MALTFRQNAIKVARQANKSLAAIDAVLSRVVAEVTYSSVTIQVTQAETEIEEIYETGLAVTIRHRDFLIEAADYAFAGLDGGALKKPEIDDEIVVTLDDGPATFRVVPNNERPYRRSDRYGFVYRVHSKEVII